MYCIYIYKNYGSDVTTVCLCLLCTITNEHYICIKIVIRESWTNIITTAERERKEGLLTKQKGNHIKTPFRDAWNSSRMQKRKILTRMHKKIHVCKCKYMLYVFSRLLQFMFTVLPIRGARINIVQCITLMLYSFNYVPILYCLLSNVGTVHMLPRFSIR